MKYQPSEVLLRHLSEYACCLHCWLDIERPKGRALMMSILYGARNDTHAQLLVSAYCARDALGSVALSDVRVTAARQLEEYDRRGARIIAPTDPPRSVAEIRVSYGLTPWVPLEYP